MNALRAGVASIEHGIFADEECFDLMGETGAYLVPTLLAPVALIQAIDAGSRVPAAVEAKARAVVDTHREMTAAAIRAGVRIAMGTDSGVFAHGRNIEELQLMVGVGMSPPQALVAATSTAAELLRLPDRGVVEPGRRADLVVVDGDPYDFDTHADRLTHVFKAGKLVRQRETAA
jgi:imidazolonepropionase-like amidohydrolase